MLTVREKIATQVDAEILESVRSLAKAEGRQIQAVVEDALLRILPLIGAAEILESVLDSRLK